jgi:hypothetical protein
MPITINPMTHVITIPKADTDYEKTNGETGYEIRSYDEYDFMRELSAYTDNIVNMTLLKTHIHDTESTIAGVTYARKFQVLSPYTITFEDGSYQVLLSGGSNNNIVDVLNPNNVSVIPANSAGLQVVTQGSGVTNQDKTDIIDGVWDHADGDFLLKIIKNKKSLEKAGSVWQLIVYDDDNATPILTKDLKDKDLANITDLAAGTLAVELASSV